MVNRFKSVCECGNLFIGYKDLAEAYLSKFKWGKTFLTMNDDFIDAYSKCASSDEVVKVQNETLDRLRAEREANRGTLFLISNVFSFNF